MQDPQSASIASLVSDALQRVTNLMRGELELARAEFAQGMSRAATGLALILGATVMGITALNVAAGAIVAALVESGLTTAIAAAIVTALFAVATLLLGLAGIKSLKSAAEAPDRVVSNLRKDANTLKEIVPNGTEH